MPSTIATMTAALRTTTAAVVAPASTGAPPIIGTGPRTASTSTKRRSGGGTNAYCPDGGWDARRDGLVASRIPTGVSPECPATTVVGFRAKRPSVGSCRRRGSKEERQPSPHIRSARRGATHCTSGLEHTVITIGIDPHKGSHTATAVDASEAVVGELRVAADRHQRARLLEWAARFEPRRWAIEGATGMGALLAQQLVGAGEHVVDVPPKRSARVRLMDTGRIDKTDPTDARSAAIVAVRNATLNTVGADSEHRVVLRLLANRYHQLTAQRTRSVCRLHALLCLLIEGGTDRSLSTGRAVELLAGVAISDPITAERVATCRQFVTELEALDQALVDIRVRTVTAVDASKTTVIDLYGVGPAGPAIPPGKGGHPPRSPPGGPPPPPQRHRPH